MRATRRRRSTAEQALKPGTELKVSPRTVRELSSILKLLAEPARLKILLALAQDGELHVTALCDLLKQSQPAVSHHLTLLRMSHLVQYRRNGKHNIYSLDSARVRDALETLFRETNNQQKQLVFEDFVLTYKRK